MPARVTNITVLNSDQGDEVFVALWLPLTEAQALLSKVAAGTDPLAADSRPLARVLVDAARAAKVKASQ